MCVPLFFGKNYGYAVLPTLGKGGFGVGGAHGTGRVYVEGEHVGDTSMTQITVGFQLGGQACSQILQGHGGLHGRKRRADVRSQHRGSEVQLQAEAVDSAYFKGGSTFPGSGRPALLSTIAISV